jgi:hypothetical protein
MGVFNSVKAAKFKDAMTTHLAELAPDHVSAMGQADMSDFLDQALRKARSFNVSQRETTRLWLELSMLWGIGFASDPTYAFAHKIVSSSLPELPRMRRLHSASIEYTKRVCGDKGKHFRDVLDRLQFMEMPAAGTQPDDTGIAQFLAHLWPERAQLIGIECLEELADKTGTDAAAFGLPSTNDRLLFAILGLILGAEFAADPQYRWLVHRPAEKHTERSQFDAINRRSLAYLRTVLKNA